MERNFLFVLPHLPFGVLVVRHISEGTMYRRNVSSVLPLITMAMALVALSMSLLAHSYARSTRTPTPTPTGTSQYNPSLCHGTVIGDDTPVLENRNVLSKVQQMLPRNEKLNIVGYDPATKYLYVYTASTYGWVFLGEVKLEDSKVCYDLVATPIAPSPSHP